MQKKIGAFVAILSLAAIMAAAEASAQTRSPRRTPEARPSPTPAPQRRASRPDALPREQTRRTCEDCTLTIVVPKDATVEVRIEGTGESAVFSGRRIRPSATPTPSSDAAGSGSPATEDARMLAELVELEQGLVALKASIFDLRRQLAPDTEFRRVANRATLQQQLRDQEAELERREQRIRILKAALFDLEEARPRQPDPPRRQRRN